METKTKLKKTLLLELSKEFELKMRKRKIMNFIVGI